jgi:5-(carboxyamino)imidazole ribonucleotide synthase
VIGAPWEDSAARPAFLAGLDVVTYEFENVSRETVAALAAAVPLHPGPASLRTAGDRCLEKQAFEAAGLAVPPWRAVHFRDELEDTIARLGFPLIAKTRRLGYDGKGQAILRSPADIDAAWAAVGSAPLIVERLVPFDRELSLIAARGRDGSFVAWPLVQNHHRGGILRLSVAPAPAVAPAIAAQAEATIRRLMESLGHVGVLALELFQCGDLLLGNEMAPRVHNSGHWTIEGATTSQFENHLRAVAGLPLGPATMTAPHAAMLNLVGTPGNTAALAGRPGVTVHLYGKTPRPGRKLGHVTVTADSAEALGTRLAETAATLGDAVLIEVVEAHRREE